MAEFDTLLERARSVLNPQQLSMTPNVALSVQLLRLHRVMYSLVFALICGARWDSALNAPQPPQC